MPGDARQEASLQKLKKRKIRVFLDCVWPVRSSCPPCFSCGKNLKTNWENKFSVEKKFSGFFSSPQMSFNNSHHMHVSSGNSSSYNSFAALHVVERLHVL